MLSRFQVISRFLQLFDTPSYLEIGVDRGETFHNLRASLKIGVDPKFAFDTTLTSRIRVLNFMKSPATSFLPASRKVTSGLT